MHQKDDKYRTPEPTKDDTTHAIARAGIASLPVVGAAGVELFSRVIAPPIENRRNQWMDSVAEGLRALEERVQGFSIDALSQNEQFISTVMDASQAAVRNHHQEKLEALRNAVLNVALGRGPSEDLQQMFLGLVDVLAPWHLRILQFFTNPSTFLKIKGIPLDRWYAGGPSTVLEEYFDDLRGQRSFYDLLVRDLHARGLFGLESLHVTMTAQGMIEKRTTEFGDRFLAFISKPKEILNLQRRD